MRNLLTSLAIAAALLTPAAAQEAKTGYAPVNGMEMYYEIHGEGEPIVLLHGAYMSIPSNWDALIPTLSETRQVIAVELQGHARTADIDRPITYEAMADDVAALLEHLKIESAAVFGYSMGAGVAIQVAVRHPEKVDRLIAASSSINYDGLPEDFMDMVKSFTPEMFKGTPFEAEYQRLAPNKDDFPQLFEKLKALDLDPFAWPEEEIARIDVPTLLIFGDADIVTMEHATKMYRLLGGITNGDIHGLPKVQMAVLPGTSHIGVFFNPQNIEIMKKIVPTFLEQELPQKPQPM